MPNFHHFSETEQDITIYIPLIDLNMENGGRLAILPEARSKLRVPGNVLLKLMEEFFGAMPSCVDAAAARDILQGTSASSWMLKGHGPRAPHGMRMNGPLSERASSWICAWPTSSSAKGVPGSALIMPRDTASKKLRAMSLRSFSSAR